jgi:sulfite reductase beta subunit-like hemoprotein
MPLLKEEQIKKDKHPFDAWEDLLRASKEGFASIAPENFLRFRWFGIYQQRPKTDPFFMLRLKIPGGRLNAKQLRVIGEVSRDRGRGFTDITTRQNFQFHWLEIEAVPDVLEKFEKVGITTRGACGDIARNITSSPLAGLEPEEVDDLQDLIEILHKKFLEERTFTNLPRKFKVSITGGITDAAQPEINDVGIYGFRKENGTPAFAVRVGGGLSSDPMFAKPLPIALKRDEIVPVVMAILGIFYDFGNRTNRRKARMKFLVADWGPEKFLKEIEKRSARSFERCIAVPAAKESGDLFWGVIPQKQKGFFAVGIGILAGRLKAEQIFDLADLSERYGNGELRTTNRQNILITNVPEGNLELLKKELRSKGFDVDAAGFQRSLVVCTGREFCNLALAEVKEFAKGLVAHLSRAFPDFSEKIRLHVTGCSNSCGQYQIADIGLLGAVKVVEGVRRDAFHIAVGGRPGIWGRTIFQSVLAEKVPALLEKMVRVFLEKQANHESFGTFCRRFKEQELVELFSGHAAR